MRLVANETLYTGPLGAGRFCTGPRQFIPVNAGALSFVLADKLAYCRFAYLVPATSPGQPPQWKQLWTAPAWPLAVRVEMAPLEADPARVQPVSVVAPVKVHRNPEIRYEDLEY